jgi:hypothetical protein
MKKIVAIVGAIVAIGAILVFTVFGIVAWFQEAQRADYGWNPRVAAPTFTREHPLVLIDDAHHNASSPGIAGRYWPFARLLRADGYAVRQGRNPFTAATLHGVRVLVIANASGAPKPQVFGINLPVSSDNKRSDPAFTAAEIEAVRSWVEQGGSLLFIADHAPFGESAAGLGAAFGVTMHKGFTEVPGEVSDPLLFSRENGRLGDHPIVNGDRPGAAVARVMTFTGESLDGPAGATVLLRLPSTAVEWRPEAGADTMVARPAGRSQGLAFEYGKGRVVVLGEAAMATAQVHRGVPFGMNSPGNDNQQFVINTMRWLSGE